MDEPTSGDATSKTDKPSSELKIEGETKDNAEEKSESSEGKDDDAFVVVKFKKYFEKEGVLEYLTKHLVPLYEKADKPTSVLEYLKNNFARKEVAEAKQKAETLESKNRDLKKNVGRLETEKNALTSQAGS